MSEATSSLNGPAPLSSVLAAVPSRAWLPAIALLAAAAVLFLPSYWVLAKSTWSSDSQGHMPIILALSWWLIYRDRHEVLAAPERPAYFTGSVLLAFGLMLYVLGRSQAMITAELAAQVPIYIAFLLLWRGWRGFRAVWFPVVFLLFTVPLPGVVTQALTVPLKIAVSTVAEAIMYHAGYPTARTGVILSVGPYQLMVADACSGLSSIFTLEALGLLYMKLMDYRSAARNAFIAIAVIPISFASNVIRVVVLCLVTYHLGDEVGQGFLHGAAGMLLFMVALVLLLGTDKILNLFRAFDEPKVAHEQPR